MITSKVERHYFYLEKEARNDILTRHVNWDDNPIGLVTLYRTYLRKKKNGQLETWNECVLRVIEGMFSFQKTHVINSGLIWDESRAQRTAINAATRLFEFKWTPPGRGLWMMGTEFVWEKGGAALNNCGFVSTEYVDTEFSKPFRTLMDYSMLGVGVGFDTAGAKKLTIQEPSGEPITIVVEDSREGWVHVIGEVIDSYFKGTNPIEADTHLVREYGQPISGFGGVASGPRPLIQGINGIKDILNNQIGNLLSSVTITDIQNIIGKIVIAGNVRRTAEIAFAEPNDVGFRTMKSWKVDPVAVGAAPPAELKLVSEEDYEFYAKNMFTPEGKDIVNKYADEPWAYKFGGWRWASNNSVFATVGMDYTELAESIGENGEPGIAWLENMRNYSRMNNGPDYKDIRADGGNPCLEQTLESNELCCLVESYPSRHQSAKDFYETLKVAYLYAKTVTLIATHNNETNTIICRNRRIGTSQSGIIDAIHKFGRYYFQKNMLDIAYDKIVQFDDKYSEWLGVPKSIKKSSVKPSGCRIPTDKLRVLTENGTEDWSYNELYERAGITLSDHMEKADTWISPYDGKQLPMVLDMNNDPQEITGLYINGLDDVYEVEFEDGSVHTFTGNHKLYTTNNEWKRVDELTVLDEIKTA